jgi:hypothetical protein
MRGKSFRGAWLLAAFLALAPGAAWGQFGAAGYAPADDPRQPRPMSITCGHLGEPPVLVFFSGGRPNVPLPKGSEDWDYLGTFRLVEGRKTFTVCLYAQDTDSIAAKREGGGSYPNFFSLHAMYRAGSGAWVHKKVYGAARVRFSRIVSVTPDAAVLELCPNVMIFSGPNGYPDWVLERAAEINKPFTERLRIVGGVPTLK